MSHLLRALHTCRSRSVGFQMADTTTDAIRNCQYCIDDLEIDRRNLADAAEILRQKENVVTAELAEQRDAGGGADSSRVDELECELLRLAQHGEALQKEADAVDAALARERDALRRLQATL